MQKKKNSWTLLENSLIQIKSAKTHTEITPLKRGQKFLIHPNVSSNCLYNWVRLALEL